MPSIDFNDMTLYEMRPHLAAAVAEDAAFDGWGPKALANAAERLKINPAIASLAFPSGAIDMIDAWLATVDDAMISSLPTPKLAKMKIRDRITTLVEARLVVLAPKREALRRAQAIMANPQNAPKALSMGWRSADVMWRTAGDTATDYNHYSKRAILASIYAATMIVFVNDESDDWSETRAFLGRRIEGIMQFEKAKAQLSNKSEHRFSVSRFLGRLRYPAA